MVTLNIVIIADKLSWNLVIWKKIQKLRLIHKGGQESFKEKVDEYRGLSAARINRLMADHDNEESKLLYLLRTSLMKEFGVDVWEEALEIVGEGDLKALYFTYQEIADGKSKCRIEPQVTI